MGNCMETCSQREEEGEVKPGGVGKNGAGAGKEGSFKIKVLLTRGELQWLMLQLEEEEKRLEDVLMEMGRDTRRREEAGKAQGWKPSLESIMEVPEVQSSDTGE